MYNTYIAPQAANRYCSGAVYHRQSRRITYRPQSKPAPTDLQPNSYMFAALVCRLWSPPRNTCNYMDYYSFTDPEGWKAELAWLVDP